MVSSTPSASCTDAAPSASGSAGRSVRNDLETMLLPFFPEEGAESYTGDVDGHEVHIFTDDPSGRIATAADRKILNLLAARIGAAIRSGATPTRHIRINARDIIADLAGDGVFGGSEYQRVTERLERLHATKIITEHPLGASTSRRRQFGWIDSFEQDIEHTPGGRKIIGLKISLSEDAFEWITRRQGFDVSREEFHSITSSRSSIWRIYEICLAQLLRDGGEVTRIGLDELRQRVPMSSQLKVFKSRTLRNALAAIEGNPYMSQTVRISLERQTDDGFEPIEFSKRAVLDQLVVAVRPGPGPLPRLNSLIPGAAERLIEETEIM